MVEDLRMALRDLLRKAELDGDVDFLSDCVRVLAQELMELDVRFSGSPATTSEFQVLLRRAVNAPRRLATGSAAPEPRGWYHRRRQASKLRLRLRCPA
jgi:hypothetical protein